MLLMARIGGGSVRHPSGWSLYLGRLGPRPARGQPGFDVGDQRERRVGEPAKFVAVAPPRRHGRVPVADEVEAVDRGTRRDAGRHVCDRPAPAGAIGEGLHVGEDHHPVVTAVGGPDRLGDARAVATSPIRPVNASTDRRRLRRYADRSTRNWPSANPYTSVRSRFLIAVASPNSAG